MNSKYQKHICSICKRNYIGYGNNAQPINNGRCCDKCNTEVVIPMRINRYIYGLDMYSVELDLN